MHDHDPLVRRERLRRTHVVVAEEAVREVAARVPASLDRSVLGQAGRAALDAAAASYDPSSGLTFAAYVRARVRSSLLEVLRSHDWTATPARASAPADRRTRLADALGELPAQLAAVVGGFFLEQRSVAELAVDLGLTEQRVLQLRAEALVQLRDRVSDVVPVRFAPVAPVSPAAAVGLTA